LVELLGNDYSQDRHPIGVDMAFALALRPVPRLSDLLAAKRSADGPLVGVNISGLLVNSGSAGRRSLGIELDYPLLVQRVVTGLVEAGAGHIFLVPHVLTPGSVPDPESDPQACQALFEKLAPDAQSRTTVVSAPFSAAEIKAFISELDWFIGTRMHATIAALSTGVPTTALAYSAKFRGVFDLCGSQEQVIDLRTESLEDCLNRALSGYDQRQTQKTILAERLPALKEDCANQMRRILACAISKECSHVSI
jgi:hypothetical protein